METYLIVVNFNRESESDEKKGKESFESALDELGSHEVLKTENTYKLETKNKHIRVRRTLSRSLEEIDDLTFGQANKIQEI